MPSLAAAAARSREVFLSQVLILLPDQTGHLSVRGKDSLTYRLDEREEAVARWVLDHGKMAGMTTDTLPAAWSLWTLRSWAVSVLRSISALYVRVSAGLLPSLLHDGRGVLLAVKGNESAG